MPATRTKTLTRAPAVNPVPVAHRRPAAVQAAPGAERVSSPSNPAEREAESIARKVVRMPFPAESAWAARFSDARRIARQHAASPRAPQPLTSHTSTRSGSGAPLPSGVRAFMEPRFAADFGAVRVHTDDQAAQRSRQLEARAFTIGADVSFARGQFQPETEDGRELLAHELAHTIQQRGSVQQGEVRRSADVRVAERSAGEAQRAEDGGLLGRFAGWANAIPGFRFLTIVLGVNPITMSRVERTAANVLRALVELVPGGAAIRAALDTHALFDRAGAWVDAQLRTLGLAAGTIGKAVKDFLASLRPWDLLNPGAVWERAKRILTEPIARLRAFGEGLVAAVVQLVKDAILRPLAELARKSRGYDLLRAVLGKDPISGEPVPRTAEALIGGFMKLIGQEELWSDVQRAKAIPRAWAWFQGALASLLGFVRQIPGLLLQAVRSLQVADVLLLPRALGKIAGVFGDFVGRFVSWAGAAMWSLLEIVFSVVAPGVMPYLRKAAGAFRQILRNPIGFLRNLVRAGTLGFEQFARNFLGHLKASLIGWLTGALGGLNVHVPQSLTFREVLKFILSVLGLTWQNVRAKLVKAIGETAVSALETGVDIVVTLVKEGPAAAWEKIKETLGNLRDMVLEQIMAFVQQRVIQAAITKLLMMLNPAGAFIQAILAIYNTVMFFVERLRQIAQVAASIIDSLAAIVAGAIAPAANRVEQTLAGLLTLVISFLARIAGLGKVTDAVTRVVDRVRAPIDKALDRVVDWIVNAAKKLGRFVAKTAGRLFGGPLPTVPVAGDEPHTLVVKETPAGFKLAIRSAEQDVATFIDAIARDPRAKTEVRAVHLKAARAHLSAVNACLLDLAKAADATTQARLRSRLLETQQALSHELRFVLAGVDMSKYKEKYRLEGIVGTYAGLPKLTRDRLTPDHQPQAKLLELVAGLKSGGRLLFGGLRIQELAARRAAQGVAINLHELRHYKTRTYGRPVEREAALRDTADSAAGDDKKRGKVMDLVRAELGDDVTRVRDIMKDPPGGMWADIDEAIPDKQKAGDLKAEIKSRILDGEKEVERQDLDRWTDKT